MSGWKLVPAVISPAMVAAAAVNSDAATPENLAIAAEALAYLPPSEHPDVADILADVARDYHNALSAAPPIPDEVVETAARIMLVAIDKEARAYEAAGRPDADHVCDFSNLDELPPALRDGWLRVVRAALAALEGK